MVSKKSSNATTPNPQVSESESRPQTQDTCRTETPADCNIAHRCAQKGYVDRFIKCFEDEEDPFHECISEMMVERDEDGKAPLEYAALIGTVGMVKELIARGVDPNTQTAKGYTALHLAAAWGKVQCVKVLVDHEANIQLKTSQGERAREVAARYNQSECVDYLDWAEAKQNLQQCVRTMRETVSDPEKVQGRLSRDEKKSSEQLCAEKEHWVEVTGEATTQDFITQKQEFEEACAPIWQKLNEPLPEKEVKK